MICPGRQCDYGTLISEFSIQKVIKAWEREPDEGMGLNECVYSPTELSDCRELGNPEMQQSFFGLCPRVHHTGWVLGLLQDSEITFSLRSRDPFWNYCAETYNKNCALPGSRNKRKLMTMMRIIPVLKQILRLDHEGREVVVLTF